jgi:hypothetical protein
MKANSPREIISVYRSNLRPLLDYFGPDATSGAERIGSDSPIATICQMSVQDSTVCSTLGVGGTSDQSEWISAPFWIVRHRIPIRRYKIARSQRHFNLPSG